MDLTFTTDRARFLYEEVEADYAFQVGDDLYLKFATTILHAWGFSTVDEYEYDDADEAGTAWQRVESYRE